jgi:epoxyqueuosine reductase
MLNTSDFKNFARSCGADLVGIGSMDRFEGAPKEMDPRYIFPEATAIVGLGFRIHRGCFRGIEEGTFFGAYPSMGYAGINYRDAPITLRMICNALEDDGYEAVPIQNMLFVNPLDPLDGKPLGGTRPVREGLPAPDVMIHFRISAVICGMGEIGSSKLFLSPEFGPRQRLAFLLTDAPLAPDPIFDGEICDRCMLCVNECSVGALSREKRVRVTVAGKQMEWAELDCVRCSGGYTGANPHYSPFTPEDYDMEAALSQPYGGGDLPYNRVSQYMYHLNGAIEGARCMRECFIHLEQTGRIKNLFKNPFRKRKAWRL